jgi:hypothetical protein
MYGWVASLEWGRGDWGTLIHFLEKVAYYYVLGARWTEWN